MASRSNEIRGTDSLSFIGSTTGRITVLTAHIGRTSVITVRSSLLKRHDPPAAYGSSATLPPGCPVMTNRTASIASLSG